MATLVVEDGTGLTNANSYVTIAESIDFLSLNVNSAAYWEDLDDEIKIQVLIMASSYLDQYVDWYGNKTVETSGLRWPRENVKDLDGILIADNIVPTQVKRATCDFAISLSKEDRFAESETLGISEMKVDVIELKFDKTDVKYPFPSTVSGWLRGLGRISFGSRSVKVVRS